MKSLQHIGLVYVALLAMTLHLRATQPGEVDLTFNSSNTLDGTVSSAALQTNGQIIVVGAFTSAGGVPRNQIARLNTDGNLDTSFQSNMTGVVEYLGTRAVLAQPDGKVLISGSFTMVNGQSRRSVARLNADGSLDDGFQAPTSVGPMVASMALQPDGKIIIGGSFQVIGPEPRYDIARLNADGSIDAGFQHGMIGDHDQGYPDIYVVALQPDGKVLVGGDFGLMNGKVRHGIARLNTDGSLDTGFLDETSRSGGGVVAIAVQPDGKVLIGGNFISTSNGTIRNSLFRLNANGTMDTNFLTGSGMNGAGNPSGSFCDGYDVSTIVVQTDGKILIGGTFGNVNGVARRKIARLNSDGSLDVNLFERNIDGNCGSGFGINSIIPLADGKILAGGTFTSINDIAINGIARLFGTVPSLSEAGIVADKFGFNINGYSNQTLVVEGSTNLLDWIPLQTNTLGSLPVTFSDSGSGLFTKRFYRARLQ